MKKLTALLIVVLLLFIASCSNNSDENQTNNNGNTNENESIICSHTWNSATCIKPKTCSKCQETIGEALGHTTESGICTRCNENLTSWECGEYTDEFGDPTGNKYVITKTYGTFSNSATTNSTLYAAVQIDNDDIGIMLWEYGRNLVKGTFDSENYSITILDQSGTKHYFTATIYKGSTRVYFKDADRNNVINLIKNNDTLKIYLKTTKHSISTYLFTIDTKGFSSLYNSTLN